MSFRRKVNLRLVGLILVLAGIGAISIFLAGREYSIRASEKTSKTVADLVRIGLNAHMMTGTMPQRDFFLKAIKDLSNVKEIYVIRGEAVSKQFGPGRERGIR